jgi:hypothetical protein
MNHTPALEFSRSGSSAPDLEAQPILESNYINDLDPLPRIWADGSSDSAILRIASQMQEVSLQSRSGGLITPYYVGGSSGPWGRGAFPPYVGRRLALRRAGRRRPSDPTTATNVKLNPQPGRLSMAATTLPEPGRVPGAPRLRLQHQVILALDLGQTTGWAVRARDGAITHGAVQFRPGRHEGGMPFLRFRAWLQELDETVDGTDAVFFAELRGTAAPRRRRSSAASSPTSPHGQR